MSEKGRRLRDEYAMVFGAMPASERGQAEVLEMLLEHLAIYYPNFFRISRGAAPRNADEGIEAVARIENLINGETWRVGGFSAAPLDLSARLILEYICFLSPDGNGISDLTASSE